MATLVFTLSRYSIPFLDYIHDEYWKVHVTKLQKDLIHQYHTNKQLFKTQLNNSFFSNRPDITPVQNKWHLSQRSNSDNFSIFYSDASMVKIKRHCISTNFISHTHWHRLVKKISGNPNFGGNVVITDKCRGVSQLLRGRAHGLPPKSTPMAVQTPKIKLHIR